MYALNITNLHINWRLHHPAPSLPDKISVFFFLVTSEIGKECDENLCEEDRLRMRRYFEKIQFIRIKAKKIGIECDDINHNSKTSPSF